MRKKSKTRRHASTLPNESRRSNVTITFSRDPRSLEEIQEAERRRLKQARIWEKPQGFSIVPKGRVVSLCFRQGDKLVEFAAELAGAPHLDIVIFDDFPRLWLDVHTFDSTPVSASDQVAIKADLCAWLEARGIRFSIGQAR